MGSDERELEELLRIKRQRLSTLRKQIARLGYGAPAELLTERDELEQEIGVSTKVVDPIVRGELPDDIMAAIRAYGVPASVNNALQLVEDAIYDVKKAIATLQNAYEKHGVELHDVKDKVITLNIDVRDLKNDNEEGKYGRRRNFIIQCVNFVILCGVVSAIVVLAIKVVGG